MSNGGTPKEFTFRAVFLGVLLAIVLGAANAYLGLFAGMTVSASIPAAVLSMAILRGILKKGTILENNIVQTIASSGETIAAGVIFTVPALVITQTWHEFQFWPTTLIGMTGGLLGILFMIPLRRALIVEEAELAYPEGTACAEVLKAGDEGGKGGRLIFISMMLGAIYKFLTAGVTLLRAALETAVSTGKSIFYIGAGNSLALVSVGYIVGFNVATLVFSGGVISWVIAIPLYSFFAGGGTGAPLDSAWSLWSTKIRYMGVGAMAVGGLWTIYKVRGGIGKGLKKILTKTGALGTVERVDQDLQRGPMLLLLLLTLVAVFGLYHHLTGSWSVGAVAAVLMVIAAFFFTAVSSYIVGIVGSSNTPISGMTICSLLFAALFLRLFGFTGTVGVLAVLGIAGVVCCTASSANDISQDLKTGYLVGATPRKQQIGEIIGAIIPAFFLAPILTVLHGSYGIGMVVREGVKPLVAPQATLFSKLAEAFFLGKGEIPMGMVIIGMGIALGAILLDRYLQSRGSSFKVYVMAVAIGIYLPLELTAAMFMGGLIRRVLAKGRVEEGQEGSQRGLLIASGLIAGEALMGVLIAILIFTGVRMPISVWRGGVPGWLSPVVLLLAMVLFARAAQQKEGP